MKSATSTTLALAAPALLLLGACIERETISFAADVQPVLNVYCLECHQTGGEGYEASGFSVVTYDDLMQGSEGGPMVIPGDSLGSNLLVLMEGRADPSIHMPRDKYGVVSQAEIATIRSWIDEGARNN